MLFWTPAHRCCVVTELTVLAVGVVQGSVLKRRDVLNLIYEQYKELKLG